MKKVLIIVGICIVTLGFIVFLFINSMKSEIEGRWTVVPDSGEGCFSSIRFTDGSLSNRGISIDETNGNYTQVWYGIHKVQDDKLSVELTNPKADPFEMTYQLTDDQLNLQYTWNTEEYSCTYELEK